MRIVASSAAQSILSQLSDDWDTVQRTIVESLRLALEKIKQNTDSNAMVFSWFTTKYIQLLIFLFQNFIKEVVTSAVRSVTNKNLPIVPPVKSSLLESISPSLLSLI